MKINQDFTMAVGTVQFLQKNKSNDYIQAEQIAKSLNCSLGYLQNTMQKLSKHRIIDSKRGRIGGTRLRRRRITLLDLWNVTCGEIDTDPAVAALKKPLKVFADALSKVVISK